MGALDDLLPIRRILVDGEVQPFVRDVDFDSDAVSVTVDQAAGVATIGLGDGVPRLVSDAYIPTALSTETTGAVFAAEVEAAAAAGRAIILQPGRIYYTDQIEVTNITLICLDPSNPAIIRPKTGWTGSADDAENALIKARSTYAGADAGTISAQINMGESAFSSAATLTSGAYYRIRSLNNETGMAGYTAGSSVTHAEIVQVTSASSPYSTDRALGAPHGSGSDIRLVTALSANVRIVGVRLELTANVAVGILLDGVVGGTIDVQGTGGSRALVHAVDSRDLDIRVRGDGGCNSEVYGSSLVTSRIQVRTLQTGDRYHASGTPRGAVFLDRCCAQNVIEDCRIFNRVRGFARRGGIANDHRNSTIVDCDVARYTVQDSANAIQISTSRAGGAGLDAGNTQTGNALQESGFANSYSNITLINCGSSATGANDGHSGAGLFVNETTLLLSNIVVENTSRNPGGSSPYCNGLVFWDFYGARISGLVLKGIENALVFLGGWDRVDFGDENYWDGAASAGTASIFIRYGLNGNEAIQPIDLQMGKWTFASTPTYLVANLNGITPTDFGRRKLRFRRLVVQNLGAWDDVEWVRDLSTTNNWAWGEVAELAAPQTWTVDAGTDVLTFSGVGFPDGTPVYLRNLGGAFPTVASGAALAAGTLHYTRDRSGNTSKLARTSGGTAIDFSGTGSGTHSAQAPWGCITTPTSDDVVDKVVVLNGTGFGSGPLPAGWYLVAHGPEVTARIDDGDIALRGDRVEAVSTSRTLNVNAAAAEPFGTVCGNKPTAVAGRVRVMRTG